MSPAPVIMFKFLNISVFFTLHTNRNTIQGGIPLLAYTGKFSLDSFRSSYPEPAMIPAAEQWVIVRRDGIFFTPGTHPSVLYPEDPRLSGVVLERFQYLGYRGKVPYYAEEIGKDAPVPKGTEYSGIQKVPSIPGSGTFSVVSPMKNLPLQPLRSGLSILTGQPGFVAGAEKKHASAQPNGRNSVVPAALLSTPGSHLPSSCWCSGTTVSCSPVRRGSRPGCSALSRDLWSLTKTLNMPLCAR
jgi:hypothetical protein